MRDMSLVPVAWTNDSSTCSKSSLVNCGYFSDDFLVKFVSKLERRSPLINRGYFIRTWAFDYVVRDFLEVNSSSSVQIVNLGAGYDTLYLRLAKDNLLSKCLKFIDVDQVSVVRKKHQILNDIGDWPSLLEDGASSSAHCFRENYDLLGCDLRSGRLYDLLKQKCQLNETLPTLFIAECVLNYLQPDEANAVIKVVSENFMDGYFLAYEQIHPNDAFGKFMVKHFASINSPLRHIDRYPTCMSQEKRFSDLSFGETRTVNMFEVYRQSLATEEKSRIESLEPFDEFEMWHLKCTHYALTFAATRKSSTFLASLLNRLNLSTFSDSSIPVLDHRLSINTQIVRPATNIRRFGHSCVSMKMGGRNIFIVVGGYGQCQLKSGGHKRLDNLICMDMVNFDLLTNMQHSLFARCYHSIIKLNDQRLFVFGGRHSPVKALNDAFIVELDTSGAVNADVGFKVSAVKYDDETVPRGRWRHSSCPIAGSRIAVIGGLAPGNTVLDDFWIFDQHANRWEKMPDMPCALHSHTCHWVKGKLVVIGGLCEANDAFNDRIFIFDESWLVLDRKFHGIYGHTGHLLDEDQSEIVIIGGITDDGRSNDKIILIRLLNYDSDSQRTVTKAFVLQESNDMMLTGHDSIFIQEESKLVVCGGGGNCFSFGTYFNDDFYVFDLTPIKKNL